ncbi:MAG: erythromycin esterase family protein [Paracoccaceae bacterium]
MADDFVKRERMVAEQIRARGVRDPRVLEAMRHERRERYLPVHLHDRAYEDLPLRVAEGHWMAAPHVTAYLVEALALKGGEKVLLIGLGAGYSAALLARIAGDVYAIERDGPQAEKAASALADAGHPNVHVLHDEGSRGWIEEGPFDAILVRAAVPVVPEALKPQLAHGGRMVVAVGDDLHAQEIVRITRRDGGRFDREDLADVRFVPLLGPQGWEDELRRREPGPPRMIQHRPVTTDDLPGLILRRGQSFEDAATADLGPLVERAGAHRVVLIGEASHGTSEFYRMRGRITQRLIEEHGFTIVAAEADWPDAARLDAYVRHREAPSEEWAAFARFPAWMWRNAETRDFLHWLRAHNAGKRGASQAGFYGLDLYSLYGSAQAILDYLDQEDRDLAALARQRYGCLSPWEADPAAYGHAALTGAYRDCAEDVTEILVELHRKRADLVGRDAARFLDAARNAQLVTNAEHYYRAMYYGSRTAWNLRDDHMFDTLQAVMAHHGSGSKAVVWAHNSHIGDARATEMSKRGERNLGELCVRGFGAAAYRIGFGTDHGTVAAASAWDGPMEVKQVRPAHAQSYERQFHLTEAPGLILPLRPGHELDVATQLATPRLERAIGVIYRPESEFASHYFEAELSRQFDEYIWIDRTSAVTPLPVHREAGPPDTYPFGT